MYFVSDFTTSDFMTFVPSCNLHDGEPSDSAKIGQLEFEFTPSFREAVTIDIVNGMLSKRTVHTTNYELLGEGTPTFTEEPEVILANGERYGIVTREVMRCKNPYVFSCCFNQGYGEQISHIVDFMSEVRALVLKGGGRYTVYSCDVIRGDGFWYVSFTCTTRARQ